MFYYTQYNAYTSENTPPNIMYSVALLKVMKEDNLGDTKFISHQVYSIEGGSLCSQGARAQQNGAENRKL